MGGSQEQRPEDAFSEDEDGSGYGDNSPTRNSYPIQSSDHHNSGELSDDEIGGSNSPPEPTSGFESLCISSGDYSPTQHHQQCARSRSGSCASRRSQQLSQFR